MQCNWRAAARKVRGRALRAAQSARALSPAACTRMRIRAARQPRNGNGLAAVAAVLCISAAGLVLLAVLPADRYAAAHACVLQGLRASSQRAVADRCRRARSRAAPLTAAVCRCACRICPAGNSAEELAYQQAWGGGGSSAATDNSQQDAASVASGGRGAGGTSSARTAVVLPPPGAPGVQERTQSALDGSFLMVTFGNAAYFELMSNWVRTVEPLGLPYIIAAFDDETVALCNLNNMPNKHINFGNSTFFRDDFRAFREMGAVKVGGGVHARTLCATMRSGTKHAAAAAAGGLCCATSGALFQPGHNHCERR